jgi:hypothetical protein
LQLYYEGNVASGELGSNHRESVRKYVRFELLTNKITLRGNEFEFLLN